MENRDDVMLMTGVLAYCHDCEGEQVLVPVDRAGEYCCTLCDGAVFLGMHGHSGTAGEDHGSGRRRGTTGARHRDSHQGSSRVA